jgi:hypothetical protein
MVAGNFVASTLQAWAAIDFTGLIIPLLVYSLLLALYAAFVWHFYKSVSKRDLFSLDFGTDHQWRTSLGYVLKYLVSFPVLTFLWFAALSLVLFLLSKSQTTEQILLISMGLIAAARITAYYKEGMAEEISKILPLAVLAIFLVDPTYFSVDLTISRVYQVTGLVPLLINYLFFVIVLEFVLRILFLIKRAATGRGRKK